MRHIKALVLCLLALLTTPVHAEDVGLFFRQDYAGCNALNMVQGKTLCMKADSNVLLAWQDGVWTPVGPVISTPPSPASFTSLAVNSPRTEGLQVSIGGHFYSRGSAGGFRLNTQLHLNSNVTTPILGGAAGMELRPSMYVHPLSLGPVGQGGYIHKWLDTLIVTTPGLFLPANGAVPQDAVGLHIGPGNTIVEGMPVRTTNTNDTLHGLWGLYVGGGIPNFMNGSLMISNPGGPVMPIKEGTGSVAEPTGAKYSNMLRVSGWIAPVVDPVFNSLGEGFGVISGLYINTSPVGNHVDLGNAYFATPSIQNFNGATVTNLTTLKVGGAPGSVGVGTANTRKRALWVGGGLSAIDGGLQLGSTTLMTVPNGTLGLAKTTPSNLAPGPVGARLEVQCGTSSGTAKLVMYAGTSTTPTTVVDNVGGGVAGCP